MTISSLLSLPQPDIWQTLQVVGGTIGALLITYGIFIERENQQDTVFAIGGFLLFLYALLEHNVIFILAFGAFTAGSIWEAVEIARGKHKH